MRKKNYVNEKSRLMDIETLLLSTTITTGVCEMNAFSVDHVNSNKRIWNQVNYQMVKMKNNTIKRERKKRISCI